MFGNVCVLRKRAGAPESLGWGRGGVSGEEEDFSLSAHWLIIWVSKMPLFLPKMNSYFFVLFCFHSESICTWKKSPVRTICFGWGIFLCALNLFSSSGFQTCNSLGWVFKLQSPVGGRGLDFKLTWADLRGSSSTYTPHPQLPSLQWPPLTQHIRQLCKE